VVTPFGDLVVTLSKFSGHAFWGPSLVVTLSPELVVTHFGGHLVVTHFGGHFGGHANSPNTTSATTTTTNTTNTIISIINIETVFIYSIDSKRYRSNLGPGQSATSARHLGPGQSATSARPPAGPLGRSMPPKRSKLLEALQQDVGGSSAPLAKKRRQLKRRDSDEKVLRHVEAARQAFLCDDQHKGPGSQV
jgi:hypothetical protein